MKLNEIKLYKIPIPLVIVFLANTIAAVPGFTEYESSKNLNFNQYESSRQYSAPARKNSHANLTEEELYAKFLQHARNGNEIAKFVLFTLNEYEARIRHALAVGDMKTFYNIASKIDSFVEEHFDELSRWTVIANIGPRGKIIAERILAILDGSYKIKWSMQNRPSNVAQKNKIESERVFSVGNGQVTYRNTDTGELRTENLPVNRERKAARQAHQFQMEFQRQEYIKRHHEDPDAQFFTPSSPPIDWQTGTLVMP